MPTKRLFDFTLIMIISFELALALPKAWAARRATEGPGLMHPVAETVLALH